MNKKILLAVDGSENSIRAVDYTAQVVGCAEGFTITLLHIEHLPDRDLFKNDEEWRNKCEEYVAELKSFLEDAKDILEARNIPSDNITTTYITSCKSPFADRVSTKCSMGTSIAQEILQTLREKDYDTVVIGRRGVTKAEEFLFGSVSSKIVHHAKECAVWVVA